MKKIFKFADKQSYDNTMEEITGGGQYDAHYPNVVKYAESNTDINGLNVYTVQELADEGVFTQTQQDNKQIYTLAKDRVNDFNDIGPARVSDFYELHKNGQIKMSNDESVPSINKSWADYMFSRYKADGFKLSGVTQYMFSGLMNNHTLSDDDKDEVTVTLLPSIATNPDWAALDMVFFDFGFSNSTENTCLHIKEEGIRVTSAPYTFKWTWFGRFKYTDRDGGNLFAPVNNAVALFSNSKFKQFDCVLNIQNGPEYLFENQSKIQELTYPDTTNEEHTTWNIRGGVYSAFSAPQLTKINYIIDVSNVNEMMGNANWAFEMFKNALLLSYVRIKNVNKNTDLSNAPSLNKESFTYLINNASNSNPITITIAENATITDEFILTLQDILIQKNISVYRGNNQIV